jgi:N6-adenosine-specific RNA methylase IME4
MTKYECIIADPPWQYDDALAAMKTAGLGASSQYRTMDFKSICALAQPTPGQAVDGRITVAPGWSIMGKSIADNAHLWLWITNPFLVHGYGQWLCDAWGFEPKTLITWVKGRLVVRAFAGADPRRGRRVLTELQHDPEDDLIADGDLVQHFAQGRYTRGTTEHVMFAVRGACPALCHDLPSAFIHPGRWPGRKHSEKPAVIHEWAERLSPAPRLELFARAHRSGWDAVGDELPVDTSSTVVDDAVSPS